MARSEIKFRAKIPRKTKKALKKFSDFKFLYYLENKKMQFGFYVSYSGVRPAKRSNWKYVLYMLNCTKNMQL